MSAISTSVSRTSGRSFVGTIGNSKSCPPARLKASPIKEVMKHGGKARKDQIAAGEGAKVVEGTAEAPCGRGVSLITSWEEVGVLPGANRPSWKRFLPRILSLETMPQNEFISKSLRKALAREREGVSVDNFTGMGVDFFFSHAVRAMTAPAVVQDCILFAHNSKEIKDLVHGGSKPNKQPNNKTQHPNQTKNHKQDNQPNRPQKLRSRR